MEYLYAALLLHKLKQNISEDSVKNVIKAAGGTPDDIRVKALVAAISQVNIDEVLKSAAVAVSTPAPSSGSGAPQPTSEEAKEEKKEEEALEGLSALFG